MRHGRGSARSRGTPRPPRLTSRGTTPSYRAAAGLRLGEIRRCLGAILFARLRSRASHSRRGHLRFAAGGQGGGAFGSAISPHLPGRRASSRLCSSFRRRRDAFPRTVSTSRFACGDAAVTLPGSSSARMAKEWRPLWYAPFPSQCRVAMFNPVSMSPLGTFSTSGRAGSARRSNPAPKSSASESLSARNQASMHCTMSCAPSSPASRGLLQRSSARFPRWVRGSEPSATGSSLSTSRITSSSSRAVRSALRKSS